MPDILERRVLHGTLLSQRSKQLLMGGSWRCEEEEAV
jgi:hypothetical protein